MKTFPPHCVYRVQKYCYAVKHLKGLAALTHIEGLMVGRSNDMLEKKSNTLSAWKIFKRRNCTNVNQNNNNYHEDALSPEPRLSPLLMF